jgi:hypothetical protein
VIYLEVTPVTESAFSKTNKGLYKSQETVYFGTEPLLNPNHRKVEDRLIASPGPLPTEAQPERRASLIAPAIPTREGHDDQRRPHGR